MSLHADLHTLVGAYALHALPDEERVLFQAHLRGCRACADARTAVLPNGAHVTLTISHDRDQAVLTTTDLPAPPAGKVYEVWYVIGGTMRPAALLGLRHTGQAVILIGSTAMASAVGLTAEPARGSTHPGPDPLTLLALPA